MKSINIECSRFSCASSSRDREDHHIELMVEVDEHEVISQFSAKEIVSAAGASRLLDEISLLIALEHYAGTGGMTVEDFKAILERAK